MSNRFTLATQKAQLDEQLIHPGHSCRQLPNSATSLAFASAVAAAAAAVDNSPAMCLKNNNLRRACDNDIRMTSACNQHVPTAAYVHTAGDTQLGCPCGGLPTNCNCTLVGQPVTPLAAAAAASAASGNNSPVTCSGSKRQPQHTASMWCMACGAT
jgi:hypothetical protein